MSRALICRAHWARGPRRARRSPCTSTCALTAGIAILLGSVTASADTPPSASYPIKMIRSDEDYAYLRGRQNLPFPLALKYIPLNAGDSYVSLGGEYRIKVESYHRPNLGLTRTPDFAAVSNRAFLHADIHIDPAVRLFVQLGYSDETGRKPIERPFDRGELDLAQGFLDVNFQPRGKQWRVRLGRQEISIGRYVTIREGTSIRRTFDGARIDGTLGSWSVLAFGARPTRNRPHAFDDDRDPSDFAAALVATHELPGVRGLHVDLLAMQRNFRAARYLPGPGHELRDSLGARVFGSVGNWDVDAQASHQFGRFTPNAGGKMTIDTWGAAFEGGYTFRRAPWSPRVAVRVDAAEGDSNPADRTLRTFDLPYPNLTYLTDAAYVAPRNVGDIDPFVTVQPVPAISLTAGAQFLWRLTSHDAVYTPIGTPLLPPNTAGSFVAAQPYVRVSWHPVNFIELQLAAVYAEPGDAVRSAGGRAQTYVAGSLTARF
jgi:hypothetical protein